MRDQSFLKQIAFDIFDSNNDGRISHLDIYKVFHKFNQGPTEEKFADIFYQDMCQLSRKISTLQNIKNKDILEKNGGDKLFTKRANHFRNL